MKKIIIEKLKTDVRRQLIGIKAGVEGKKGQETTQAVYRLFKDGSQIPGGELVTGLPNSPPQKTFRAMLIDPCELELRCEIIAGSNPQTKGEILLGLEM